MCTSVIAKKSTTSSNSTGAMFTPVPCGRCPECVKAKLNAWLFRFEQQMQVSVNPYFVTLTYNDENLVYTRDVVDGDTGEIITYDLQYPTLVKRDVQLFIKRLRQNMKRQYKIDEKLIYYAVGEYGTKRKRPHYHIIMFNLNLTDYEFYKIIDKTWSKGFVHVSPISMSDNRAISYTLKYVVNKSKHNFNDFRLKEFSCCSKGIGLSYLSSKDIDWHLKNEKNCYVITQNGYKIPIPKYYKEKLYSDDFRKRVTDYNQRRQEEILAEKVNKLLLKKGLKNTSENVNDMLKLIERRKQIVVLPKRNETL